MTPEKLAEYQQYVDFVKTNLEPLAAHLKVSVEWLWQILVNQVRVEAIVYLAVIVLMTIKGSILLYIAFKSLKKAKFYRGYGGRDKVYKHNKTGVEIESPLDDWENRKEYAEISTPNKTNMHGYIVYLCGISGAFLIALSTLTAAVAMPKIVTGLVNPEYGAIERIVEFSKGKVPDNVTK